MMSSVCFSRMLRLVVLALSMAVGASLAYAEDSSEYSTFSSSDGESFSLKCDFSNVSVVSASETDVLSATKSLRLFPGDFFVIDGEVYAAFQCTRSTSTTNDDTVWDYILNKLVKFDFSDPQSPSASIVDINWGGVGRPVHRQSWAAFAGADSEGTPYICFGGNEATNKFDESQMEICPLEIQDDGSFKVVKKMTSGQTVHTRSVSVNGSLSSGDFSLAAAYWTHETVLLKNNINSPERLAWIKFVEGELEQSAYADRTNDPEFYNASVQNLGDNYILVDDGAVFDSSVTEPQAAYATPTIVQLTKGTSIKLTKISVLDSPGANNNNNGAQIFKVNNKWFLISTRMNDDAETYACTIYALPQGPHSLAGAQEVWTLGTSFPAYQSWGTTTNPANLNTSRIQWVARNTFETDIYIYSATSEFSKYTVVSHDNTLTAQPLIEINAGNSRWYNLLGAPCRPTVPGIYIEVRPDGTTRKVRINR